MRYRVEQRIQTLAHNAVMKDGRMEAAFSVDPQLKEEGIAAIDEAAAVHRLRPPNSFGAISPGASPAPARVAHLAWGRHREGDEGHQKRADPDSLGHVELLSARHLRAGATRPGASGVPYRKVRWSEDLRRERSGLSTTTTARLSGIEHSRRGIERM